MKTAREKQQLISILLKDLIFRQTVRWSSDFYHHWNEDIDHHERTRHENYRFSISWARIIPDGDGKVNQKGIDFYNKVIDKLIEYDIIHLLRCITLICLMHQQKNTMGGKRRDCAYAFERYAKICFENFGDRVKYWVIHNEQNLMMRVDERMNICELIH